MLTPRRPGLKTIGLAIAAIGTAPASPNAPVIPAGVRNLEGPPKHLATLPRRRDFKTAPMILDHRDHRDHRDAEALDAVLQYNAG